METDLELGFPLDFNFEEVMKADFIVIGGGVAGLSAANHLADQGADVLLLEEGHYPAHKICGEFLSPEALPILKRWGIATSAYISNLEIVTPDTHWQMEFPERAATAMRQHLDAALADRATRQGAKVVTGAKVIKIDLPQSDEQPYTLTLASGEVWKAHSLLISTGRLLSSLTGQKPPKFCYVGIQAHLEGLNLEQTLQMHLMKGAYFGIAPIGKDRVNAAGLISCNPEEAAHPETVLASFLQRKEAQPLAELQPEAPWKAAPVPEFGLRSCPPWPRAYFLGDAAGVIPPATGNGLSIALTSGILAADCALKNDPELYKTLWMNAYAKRIRHGMLLHRLFLSPLAVRFTLSLTKLFPSIAHYLYRSTRFVK
jgi:flavin-dependent dehydrogenase